MLRTLVQAIVGFALVLGPSMLLNELVEPLWDNVPWSFFATFGIPLVLVAAAVVVRRRISRTAGLLLIVGASMHFIGWFVVLVYAMWITRDF